MRARLLSVLAAVSVALAVSGCTDKQSDSASTGATVSDRPSSTSPEGECGTSVPAGTSLLSVASIDAPPGASVGQSTSVVALDPATCRGAVSGTIPAGSCAPADFPWTVSAATQNEELYSRGARTVAWATFAVSGRPTLRETVIRAAAGSSLVPAFAAHVATCRGTVLATRNGQPTLVALGGCSGLLLDLEDDRVVALSALDARTPAQLTALMTRAVDAG